MYESMSKKESLPNKSVRRQSCNNMQRPSRIQPKEVVQAKRKVVYNEGSIEQSILWDSNRKKYYKNMKSIEEPDLVTQNIIDGTIKGGADELDKKYNSEQKKYVYHAHCTPIGLNEVLLEYDEIHFVETNKTNMKVYNGGEEVSENEDPFAIRLYAEGNMDHALGLAEGMDTYLSRDENYDDDIFPFSKMKGKKVLIKATEFRRLSHVIRAYEKSNVKLSELAEGKKNLEASFGGKTGNMARDIKEGEHRKYDLIQCTFFWLQDAYKAEIDNMNRIRKDNVGKAQRTIDQLKEDKKLSKKRSEDNSIHTQVSENFIKQQKDLIEQQKDLIEQREAMIKLQENLVEMQRELVNVQEGLADVQEGCIKAKKNFIDAKEIIIKNADHLLKGEDITKEQKDLDDYKESVIKAQEVLSGKEKVLSDDIKKLSKLQKKLRVMLYTVITMYQNLIEDEKELLKVKKELGKKGSEITKLENEIIARETDKIAAYKKWQTVGYNYYYIQGNELSYETMITFVKNQLKKLKEDGEVRIVVSDIRPYKVITTKLEEALGEEWKVDIMKRELNSTYPNELKEQGLNESNFAQKQTFANKNVIGREEKKISKDIIVIVKKRKIESGI